MDPIYKFSASPGTPLFPVSPERANRQNQQQPTSTSSSSEQYQQLAQSPSLPSIPASISNSGHATDSSDVQGKVAQFNSLAKDAAQRRRDNEAALKRAMLGREEAEGESRRLKEENSGLRREIEEGRKRERRVGERLESVQEEVQRAKEAHVQYQGIYEKEVRKARKEAFKSSSALVKSQEDLKNARNRYTLMREEMEAQRRKKDQSEQEAFQAHYQLAGLQEEIEALRRRLEVREEERYARMDVVKEEKVAKPAGEEAIALPPCREGEILPSPKKKRRDKRQSSKENVDPLEPEMEMESEQGEQGWLTLGEELRFEKRLRVKAEKEAHFLKMECQFGICSCRLAEMQGVKYIHDATFDAEKEEFLDSAKQSQEHKPEQEYVEKGDNRRQTVEVMAIDAAPSPFAEEQRPTPELQPTEQELITFSPTSGTFSKANPPIPQDLAEELEPEPKPQVAPSPFRETVTTPPPQLEPQQIPLPVTPGPLSSLPQRAPRTISTTTTIPLKADDPVFSPAPNTPGGISREEALEQIRLRRGRARSFAVGMRGTPAKGQDGEVKRREISAPVATGA